METTTDGPLTSPEAHDAYFRSFTEEGAVWSYKTAVECIAQDRGPWVLVAFVRWAELNWPLRQDIEPAASEDALDALSGLVHPVSAAAVEAAVGRAKAALRNAQPSPHWTEHLRGRERAERKIRQAVEVLRPMGKVHGLVTRALEILEGE